MNARGYDFVKIHYANVRDICQNLANEISICSKLANVMDICSNSQCVTQLFKLLKGHRHLLKLG